jgi:hypothetical protein
MLFLLNNQVLDIGAETDAIRAELEGRRRQPSLFQAVSMGQQVIFAGGSFQAVHPTAALRVAALIALASEANAALFVSPAQVRGPDDVAVRLAAVPLTTLSWLAQHQHEEALAPGLVNQHVWNLASSASAA